MGTRGRKSAASLEVVGVENAQRLARPEPPSDLTDEQAEEWWAVVERLPADWFQRETHAMLATYCRHVVNARRAAQLMESIAAGDFDLDEYAKASRLHEMEGRAMSSLATRMRMTQQATYDEKKKKPIRSAKPWE